MTTHDKLTFEGPIATYGITKLAQKEIGEIVYIDLPKLHSFIEKQEIIAVIESTKAALDLYSPISGTIVEINTALETDPSLLNRDPEDKGWICKIEFVKMEN